MNLLQAILEAANSWPATLRLAFVFILVVAGAWAVLWGVARYLLPALVDSVRTLLKGKKLVTPLVAVEDAPAPPKSSDCEVEEVDLDRVDEVALANPRPVRAQVMSRQLDEVFDALRGVTQIVAGGIQEADREAHMGKRDSVRIVWDAQLEAIVRRLIYNGLDAIRDRDEESYCRERAERLFHAFKDDLEERLLQRGVDRIDLHEAVRDNGPAVLDRLRLMYRTCIEIAKSAKAQECA